REESKKKEGKEEGQDRTCSLPEWEETEECCEGEVDVTKKMKDSKKEGETAAEKVEEKGKKEEEREEKVVMEEIEEKVKEG
ncbi:hypothetical protein DKP78_24425, partial [Enterococcus faecium]